VATLFTGCTILFLVACAGQNSNEEVVTVSEPMAEKVLITGARIKGETENKRMKSADQMQYMPMMVMTESVENREVYQSIETSSVKQTLNEPVSTFSIDVDTGAYANVRRYINHGNLPPGNAVRLDEMINYFDYQYPVPKSNKQPFSVAASLIETPWNKDTHLLRVGLQGWKKEIKQIPPMNLVFLVDVSGSMGSDDKLPLVKKSLQMLTKHLRDKDRVAMVVYAGSSGIVLESTSGKEKAKILSAINRLSSGGSTNGEAGINLAYQLASDNFIKEGINSVLLATDGDFNVGISNREMLVDLIERQKKQGVYLNTLGFGTGNYNDYLMEQLADKGNGIYAYIDSVAEAKKVLVDEIASSFMTIAEDVKIQLEFNPNVVKEYRLLGYENRELAEEDFNNDKVDAGEIGAGHNVTALYEIVLNDSEYTFIPDRRYSKNRLIKSKLVKSDESKGDSKLDELGFIKLRYKLPGQSKSKMISKVLKKDQLSDDTESVYFAAAVAAFAQQLKDDKYLNQFGYDDTIALANRSKGFDPGGRKAEFVQLVKMAEAMQ